MSHASAPIKIPKRPPAYFIKTIKYGGRIPTSDENFLYLEDMVRRDMARVRWRRQKIYDVAFEVGHNEWREINGVAGITVLLHMDFQRGKKLLYVNVWGLLAPEDEMY